MVVVMGGVAVAMVIRGGGRKAGAGTAAVPAVAATRCKFGGLMAAAAATYQRGAGRLLAVAQGRIED